MRSQQTRPVPFFYFSRTPPSEKQPPLSTSQTKDKKSKEKYRFLSGWKNNTPKRRRKCLLFDLLRTPFFSFLFLPPTTSATAVVSFLSLPTISRPPASVETGRHVHFLSLVLFFFCVVLCCKVKSHYCHVGLKGKKVKRVVFFFLCAFVPNGDNQPRHVIYVVPSLSRLTDISLFLFLSFSDSAV